MRVVLDASVVVKWVLPDREADAAKALDVLARVRDGVLQPIQPPHWLAEVAAVIARLRPEVAVESLNLLDAMEIPVATDLATYQRACRLATSLSHHLFDTLYHAVALEHEAMLLTADARYQAKARGHGAIASLARWPDLA